MSTSQKPKEYRLNIRLSESEWNKIQHHASNTTCRSTSEYCRKVLLNKPVRVFYRNQSFDDFEEELVRLLPMLNAYAKDHDNFVATANEIKALLIKIADTCAQEYSPAKVSSNP
jgi:uncharacterized protein (DUF1778 family)